MDNKSQNTADLAAVSFVQSIDAALQKSAEQVQKSAEQIEVLSKSLLAEQEARKQEAELRKSELEAQIELKKSEAVAKSEAQEKEIAMLKSQMNFAKYSGVNHASPSEKMLIKSEDIDKLKNYVELVKNYTFEEGSKSLITGTSVAEAITNIVLSKSSAYSMDINPLGGYLDTPSIAPITNQTNYSNEEKLFDIVGYKTTAESNTVVMPKFVYDFNDLSRVKVMGEGKPYVFNDVTKIMDSQNVTLSDLKVGFPVSQKLYESLPSVVNFLQEQMGRDVRRSISREMIRLSGADAEIKSVQTVNDTSNQVLTNESMKAMLNDLFELANLPTLRPSRFTKPVMILSRQFVNRITTFYNNFGYPNDAWIDLRKKTILLPDFGDVPYVSLDNYDLMPDRGDGNAGKTAAILMDAEAYNVEINPSKTLMTNQYQSDPHSVNVDGTVGLLLKMAVATAIIDSTRIAKLVIKA